MNVIYSMEQFPLIDVLLFTSNNYYFKISKVLDKFSRKKSMFF